jgi:hypothetical protein
MVLNHTGVVGRTGRRAGLVLLDLRDKSDRRPTFLFLVGFCLPLSLSRTRGHRVRDRAGPLWRTRSAVGASSSPGFLLNLLVFRDPIWNKRAAGPIGLSIIHRGAVGLFLTSAAAGP